MFFKLFFIATQLISSDFLLAQSAPASKPIRVISLSPALTEIVFSLGLQTKLVGVSEHSDFPEEAKKIQTVGPYAKPFLEKILLLKPDLILMQDEGSEDIKFKLEKLKLKFLVLKIHTLEDVGIAANNISVALNESDKGGLFKKTWMAELEKWRTQKRRSASRTPTAIVVQSDPPLVAGGHTFLNEALKLCQGENIFERKNGYFAMNQEILVTSKLKKLILAEHSASNQQSEKSTQAWMQRFFKLGLKNVTVTAINPDLVTRPGPRLLKGIGEICRAVE